MNVVVCCVVFNGFVVAFRYNGAVKLNRVVFGRKVGSGGGLCTRDL